MAQSTQQRPRPNREIHAKNASVSVAQSGDTDLLELDLNGAERLCAEIVVAGQALDNFEILGKFHPDGAYVVLYTNGYATPTGILVGTSGDLDTQAVGTGWFIIDTRGIYRLKLRASSGNAAGSTVSVYAGAH